MPTTTPQTEQQMDNQIDQDITSKTTFRSITPIILGTLLKTFRAFISSFFIPISQKGAADGVATLDNTGKVTTAQLPSGSSGMVAEITTADEITVEDTTGDELMPLVDATNVLGKMKIKDFKNIMNRPFEQIVFVTTSRDFEAADFGKLIVVDNENEEIILTMPNSIIFPADGKISVTFITAGGFNTSYNAPIIYPLKKTGAANQADTFQQIITFFTVDDGIVSSITPIQSTDGVIVDTKDGKSKTSVNYILDYLKKFETDNLEIYTDTTTYQGVEVIGLRTKNGSCGIGLFYTSNGSGISVIGTQTNEIDNTHGIDDQTFSLMTIDNNNLIGKLDLAFLGQIFEDLQNNKTHNLLSVQLLQIGTNAPTAQVLLNELGNVTYSYNAVGDYTIIAPSKFTVDKTTKINQPIINAGVLVGYVIGERIDSDNYSLKTFDTTGSPADDLLNNEIEIKIYNS